VKEAKKTEQGWLVMLEGRLTLHGVEKPINLQIRLTTRGRELRAEREVSLLHTDFGITPIRVGGAL
jgi:polyisoprenoid-binding protein YceI